MPFIQGKRNCFQGFTGGVRTTTGILRLKAMEKEGTLKFPMMAGNNAMPLNTCSTTGMEQGLVCMSGWNKQNDEPDSGGKTDQLL